MLRQFLIAALLAAPVSSLAGIVVVDDSGARVELPAAARRIVTLAPFLTELAFSAGAGTSVVGVSAHSDYPAEARALPEVSSAAGFSIESIVALKPELALAWKDSVRPEEIARLKAFGIAVFIAQARSLDDVPRLLTAIGTLAGRDAARAGEAYREKIARLRSTHARLPKVPVLLEIWHKPLTTIAGAHWMNEALEVCGARNAFADLRGIAPEISWEDVYLRDPPIVVGAGSSDTSATFLANWKERPTLAAVKAGRLVFVDPDLIQRPTARLADGVAQLCAGLDRARGAL